MSYSYSFFYPRELAKLRGYTSCFVVVAVAVAVAVADVADVAILLVLISLKLFENLPLQQLLNNNF
jgi:hypothetical protein